MLTANLTLTPHWPHTKQTVWMTINTTTDLRHVNQTIIWIRKEFTFLRIHSNVVSTATALFHVCLQLWLEIFVLKWAAWQMHNTAGCVLLHDESQNYRSQMSTIQQHSSVTPSETALYSSKHHILTQRLLLHKLYHQNLSTMDAQNQKSLKNCWGSISA